MTFYGRINLAMAVFFLFAGGLSFFRASDYLHYTTLLLANSVLSDLVAFF